MSWTWHSAQYLLLQYCTFILARYSLGSSPLLLASNSNKYLGVIISSNLKQDKHRNPDLNKAYKASVKTHYILLGVPILIKLIVM